VQAKILVVDDDLIQRELLNEILQLEGYTVTLAGDGLQAEQIIGQSPPDIVLLDVNIPHKNGLEVCHDIKQSPETRLIPVVMVTGLSDAEDRLMGINSGADDFLTKPIDRTELRARVRCLLKRKEYTDELDRADHVLMALGRSIEAKDPYTDGHCLRISKYSVLLGQELSLSNEDLRALNLGGSVHDIGKVGVPDAILLKPAPLSPEEWTVMRTHTLIGENICRPLRSFYPVLPIIRNHHEKQDGSGYPDGLSGSAVPLLARVMQLADVFDALTTQRPYKRALSRAEALEQMQIEVDQGWWDPELFAVFAALVEKERLPDMMPNRLAFA
jgi:putative two-component system response regulator